MDKKKKISIFLVVCLLILTSGITFVYSMGKKEVVVRTDTIKFLNQREANLIKTKNYCEYQKHNDCSGYAIAYVLRSLGDKRNGEEVYKEIETKNKDGSVTLKQVVLYLRKNEYEADLYTGTLDSLKARVDKGVPVIVFILSEKGSSIYHYTCVVGYDEKNLYLSDSISAFSNESTSYYNRVISQKEFLNLWKLDREEDNNMYIVVNKK